VISTDLISRIPLLGSTTALVTYPPTNRSFVQRYFPAFLATTATTLGLVGYYVFATGLLTWPHGDELQIFGRKRLADYGHLGAALAGMSLLGRPAAQNDGLFQQSNDNIPIGVEVELENDGAP
jgi:sorting and assembly machinery component 37